MTHLLEVCIDSIESAIAARQGGADRLEVCSSLSAQGTTPSFGLTEQCVADLGIPVMMMIRPHDGGFVYSPNDLDTMLTDIEVAKSIGVQGVVFGALRPDFTIHREHCQILKEAAESLETTFHRAFDIVPDPFDALETLISLQFDRVLTSGQAAQAAHAIPLLAELNRQASDRIVLLVGSGVNPTNAASIIQGTGVRELHASASVPHEKSLESVLSYCPRVTDSNIVRAIKVSMNSSQGI